MFVDQFDVDVLNESVLGTQKHVGRGSMPLKALIPEFNQHVSFVVPLMFYEKDGKSKNGVQKGQVIMRAFIERPAPKAANISTDKTVDMKEPPVIVATAGLSPAAPVITKVAAPSPAPAAPALVVPVTVTTQEGVEYDESQPLCLKLDGLKVRNLKNKGGSWDKQDPALRITVGDSKPFDTERFVVYQFTYYQFCTYEQCSSHSFCVELKTRAWTQISLKSMNWKSQPPNLPTTWW